ncbi:MAG: hypothetical protein IH956_03215 [Chloroflexi bacterium]|nr:hypothetical protein [Chloroflexota bacterium]
MTGMTTVTADTVQGHEATGGTKTVTSLRTWLFSGGWPPGDGWPAKNIHTDLEFAQGSGLPARNAAGAMMEGYIAELMIDMFGPGWLSTGSYSVKFIRTVDIGDRVTSRARITARRPEADGTAFEADLWCENQHGDKVVVGSGTGRVDG